MKYILIALSVALVSCSSTEGDEQSGPPDKVTTDSTEKDPQSETSFILDHDGGGVSVDVLPAKGERVGSVVLLHGWGLPSEEWCEKTDLCDELTQAGYTVIVPDHGKSTYQWNNYPETIEKYRPYPTRKWMYSSELESLRGKGLLNPSEFNAVVGLSTGGRGAALFALENPELFDACVALSADFDQTKLPDGEPINTGVYGAYSKFPDRWEGKDNIHHRADEFVVPILIGHGAADDMCKPMHSEDFYSHLDSIQPDLKKSLVIKRDSKHDYLFWGSMTPDILGFLEEVRQAQK